MDCSYDSSYDLLKNRRKGRERSGGLNGDGKAAVMVGNNQLAQWRTVAVHGQRQPPNLSKAESGEIIRSKREGERGKLRPWRWLTHRRGLTKAIAKAPAADTQNLSKAESGEIIRSKRERVNFRPWRCMYSASARHLLPHFVGFWNFFDMPNFLLIYENLW